MTATGVAPKTPVLLLGFNRPDLFAEVLEAVRAGGPRELFISIDGPRRGNVEDAALCAEVRELAEGIDWAPAVHLKAEARNLGCGPAVSSAITWALDATPEIIVLEDDCLPHPSFLVLCDELLERYRDDERVMQISGTNWGAAEARFGGYSYAFTSFAPVWGWATWRRAWNLYDYRLATWPRAKADGLADSMLVSRRFGRLLRRDWDRVRAGGGTWDHQWQYTVIRNHGFSLCPARNAVRNIGFRTDATHSAGGTGDRVFSRLPLEEVSFPLRHPPEIAHNPEVEAVFGRIYAQKRGWPAEIFAHVVSNPRLNHFLRRAWRKLLPRPS